MKHLLISLIITGLAAAQDGPKTTAEGSGWTRTSTNADVWRFLDRLEALPYATRLTVSTAGHSVGGRRLAHVKVRSLADDPLRVLIIADIHGGEVEGKEVVQVLLREIGYGKHEDLLSRLELHIIPVFNPDGNDEINRGNRINQNGPEGGVGRRANGQGFDLNRDFVKVESPEVRTLIRLMNRVDPHLFMDLHTTNGSHHGYHLTYAPSLSPNQDPRLDAFMHDEFMPSVRAWALARHGIRAFDYGNTGRRPPREGEVRRWTTFSGDARLAWNYGALRNRLSVLSEAYSYLSFKERARATKAFVLANLHVLVDREKTVRAICDAAELRIAEGKVAFGYDTELAPAVRGKLLVGSVQRKSVEGGTRLVANPEYEEVDADLLVRFRSTRSIPFPFAWAITKPTEAVTTTLLIHGIQVRRLVTPADAEVETYRVSAASKRRSVFQGHRLVSVNGTYEKRTLEVPKGALIVTARQPLARLAAQLLEPVSEDGLTTWNFFDDALAGDASDRVHPVVRILNASSLRSESIALDPARVAVPGALRVRPERLDNALTVQIVCEHPGRRVTSGAYETAYRYEGRVLSWRVGDEAASDSDILESLLAGADKGRPVVIRPGRNIIQREISAAAECVRKAGFKDLYLQREPE